MLRYNEKQLKQFAKEGSGIPVYEMCANCCRVWAGYCIMITDPLHFYKRYGRCFAWMNSTTAQNVENKIKAYSNTAKGAETREGQQRKPGKHRTSRMSRLGGLYSPLGQEAVRRAR